MTAAILIIVFSSLLIAFCSGVETGLYRVPRVRLVLDSVDGSRVARGLLWLTNHPGLFVSTFLFGNAIANYGFTVGIGWLLLATFGVETPGIVLAANLLTTPVLFVTCELLPKSLFHKLPHRLLSLSGAPLLVLTAISFPVTWMLYLLSRGMQRLLGEEPLRIRPALAKRELRQVLQEGEQVGLLEPIQRELAQNLFAFGGESISRYCMPLRGLRCVSLDATLEEVQQAVARTSQTVIPVLHSRHKRVVGYYHTSEIRNAQSLPRLRAMSTFVDTSSQIEVLSKLVEQDNELARIINANGDLIGVVLRTRLVGQMFQRG